MLLRRKSRFWRTGLNGINKKISAAVLILAPFAFILNGCGGHAQMDRAAAEVETVTPEPEKPELKQAGEVFENSYNALVRTGRADNLETVQKIVHEFGKHGYVAVDDKNRTDMVNADQVMKFCQAVNAGNPAELTMIAVADTDGFHQYDIVTENGDIDITSSYYEYNNGRVENRSVVCYPADVWELTEEGYLIFEGSGYSDEQYALTFSELSEHTAFRVKPLDRQCREWNHKYLQPVGYERNNLFLLDWNENDFGDLDFYDLFDAFYESVEKRPFPYTMAEHIDEDAVYQIPEEEFESVIMTYLNIDSRTLRSKTVYDSKGRTYEYRPRGFYDAEYPDIPYPEVVSGRENADGTIELFVNAVYPNENTSKLFSHRVVIRPMEGGGFQYVSNQMPDSAEDADLWWHTERSRYELK